MTAAQGLPRFGSGSGDPEPAIATCRPSGSSATGSAAISFGRRFLIAARAMRERSECATVSHPTPPTGKHRAGAPATGTFAPMAASSGQAPFPLECRSALDALPRHWALTPVKGKVPYRPRWSEEPPVERELIAEEIARGHASGFALRTGPASGGVFAVDEDGPGSLELLPGAPGPIGPSVSVVSGRPGHCHRLFALPEAEWPAIRNRTVFASEPAGPTEIKVALRFDAMITCLPPSLHPHSGRYRWADGLDPDAIGDGPAPGWVVRHAEYGEGEADSIVNAAWRGDRDRVAADLRAGTMPDAPAPDGHTALHRAVWGGHVECTGLLLAAGAEVGRPDPKGDTALILASAQGQTEIVGALLDAGAGVGDRDAAGGTALHSACWGGHADVAEVLVDAGADRWARDVSGGLPADRALRWGYGELARWTLSREQAGPAPPRRAAGG